jgi:putative flippase GtrA
MRTFVAFYGRARRAATRIPKGVIFLFVGMVGLATHISVLFTLIHVCGFGKSPAWFCGFGLATVVTWQLNRRFTFQSTGRRKRAEVLRYLVVTACAQSVSYSVFLSVGAFAPFVPSEIATFVGAVVATIFSYSGQRFFTFAPHKANPATLSSDVLAAESAPVQEVPFI